MVDVGFWPFFRLSSGVRFVFKRVHSYIGMARYDGDGMIFFRFSSYHFFHVWKAEVWFETNHGASAIVLSERLGLEALDYVGCWKCSANMNDIREYQS